MGGHRKKGTRLEDWPVPMRNIRNRLLVILGLIIVSVYALVPKTGPTGEKVPAINLGLDLQGGMHLAVEVDDPDGTLTTEARADALDRTLTTIRNRIDEFGVREPTIQRVGDERIVVELAGIDDPVRAKGIVERTAFLQFKIVREDDDTIEFTRKGQKNREKFQRDEIAEIQYAGRPILVGTVSIERSELISSLLDQRGVNHEVLNAKFHKREAEIVAQAGRMGAVTIATNMAGRGTDIKLGAAVVKCGVCGIQSNEPAFGQVAEDADLGQDQVVPRALQRCGDL